MNLNLKSFHWFILSLLALGGIIAWMALALPRYQMIDLSVDRTKAIEIAKTYLSREIGVNAQGYRSTAVFSTDTNADRYLQKTLGAAEARKFVKQSKYDFFYWDVRFFKEKQKEEFKVVVSSKTGEVINFSHDIEDTAKRSFVELNAARQFAVDFVTRNYGFSLEKYIPHSQNVEKKENRVDYSFSWEAKNVEIPWNMEEGGKAKLLMTVGISGQDILYFNKNQLSIPEGFSRYIDRLKQTGENLMLVSQLLYMGLLTVAIMLLVNRRRFVIPQAVRPFYTAVGAFLFIGIILDVLNGYQQLIYNYPTTQSFWPYLVKDFISTCVAIFFTVLVFILSGLSGESLRYEIHSQEKKTGFLSPVLSSFFSKPVAQQIWVGYLLAPVILSVQTVIFILGYKFFGVWDELSWLVQSSTAVIPALSVFVFGFHSSMNEEIMFRLFAINLFKRYGINTVLAVLLSSLMWGLGHTGYDIFPMWFRGLEVTLLGIIFGFVYLRFGLITVVVAHFLIDAFRDSLQYLIHPGISFDFLSCLFMTGIPLMFSLIAYQLNRSTVERAWEQKFTPQQEFNYQLLKQACSLKTPQEMSAFKEELIRHGWDPVIIKKVFESQRLL